MKIPRLSGLTDKELGCLIQELEAILEFRCSGTLYIRHGARRQLTLQAYIIGGVTDERTNQWMD